MDDISTYNLYSDIQKRTSGEIYIGVVGPVRTGKSTFIKRFMELLVIPKIDDENNKKRAIDELPQASAGKTVMTTEPKFIPKDAISIVIDDDINLKCRLIDCVGFMVEGAEGHMEDGKERLVKTPWFEYDIPFTKAAEIGTRKVICDHSTLGIVVTCDGSISDIKREGYVAAEEKTIEELNEIGKPFVIVLNSIRPKDNETKELANELSQKYQKKVIPVNLDQLKQQDINKIFESLLLSFPVMEIDFYIPKWLEAVDNDNLVKNHLISLAKSMIENIDVMGDVEDSVFSGDDFVDKIMPDSINMSDGKVGITFKINDKYYFEMLSELFHKDIKNEYEFIKEVRELSETKSECSKVNTALKAAMYSGYGSVTPEKQDIVLDEPELIKSGNKYGVKIRAKAPSLHLIKANITTEIAPIVGSEEQARDLINYIKEETGGNYDKIWGVSIFGKTVSQLVDDGMSAKVNKINEESQQKLCDTMEKIVNESNGGLVCIII